MIDLKEKLISIATNAFTTITTIHSKNALKYLLKKRKLKYVLSSVISQEHPKNFWGTQNFGGNFYIDVNGLIVTRKASSTTIKPLVSKVKHDVPISQT